MHSAIYTIWSCLESLSVNFLDLLYVIGKWQVKKEEKNVAEGQAGLHAGKWATLELSNTTIMIQKRT